MVFVYVSYYDKTSLIRGIKTIVEHPNFAPSINFLYTNEQLCKLPIEQLRTIYSELRNRSRKKLIVATV